MARIEQLILIDDFDGSQAAETIPFSLDGADYSIELSAANAAEMRQMLRPFIDAGRRVPRLVTPHGTWMPTHHLARPRTVNRTDRGRAGRVRAWARRNGVHVANQGVISAKVHALYDKAMTQNGN